MLAGDTPLIDAARHGRAADVTTLLAGVFGYVNEPNSRNGSTALVASCAKGHTTMLSRNCSLRTLT